MYLSRNKIKVISLAALIFCSISFAAHGQFVVNGDTPHSLKWMQVKGDTYQVVYPQGADSLAKRYLWLLESNSDAVMAGLQGIKPSKIPVVLYNRTANSNGMVVWAPKRMELYTLPMSFLYPGKWDVQLALHESRHVGQLTHFTKGVFNVLGYIIGQQSPSIGVGIYTPRWMLEGDAVVAETELSASGRGRNAEFMEYYRAMFLEGETRGWNRWRLGSYKYYTPGIYSMGYLINSTIRYRTGNYDYAGEVFDGLVKRFYNPAVERWSYTKAVGKTPKQFFKEGEKMMTQMWKEELGQRGTLTAPQQILQKRGRGYQEYSSAAVVGKDSVLYLKTSFNNPTRLVLVHGGKEKVIRAMSSSVQGFQVNGDYLYFAENIQSSRWSNEVYGNVYSYNWRKSSDMKKLSGKSFYKAPQPTATGDTLVVGEYYPNGGSAVVLLDSRTGDVLERIAAPSNGELVESLVLGKNVYALLNTDGGLGLYVIGEDRQWRTVIEDQMASITSLQSAQVPAAMLGLQGEDDVDVIYFVSDIDGVRNIYMVEPHSGLLRRLTNSRYGAGEPCIGDGKLYYSQLELWGKFPVQVSLADTVESGSEFEPQLVEGRFSSSYRYRVADELSAQATKALKEKNIEWGAGDDKQFEEYAAGVEAERYSKVGNLFRIHSWAPVYYNVDRIMNFDYDNLYKTVSLGATVYSQNTLGTAVSMLGYSWKDGLHAGHFKFNYTGLYPAFQISADINSDERYRVRLVKNPDGVKKEVEQLESPLVELEAVAYVPLSFSSHGWQRSVVPQVNWSYKNIGYYNNAESRYLNASTLGASVKFYAMRPINHSGIFPKWGIGGTAKWNFSINGGENFGDVSSLYLYGYLPGIAANHGIKLSAAVQRQNMDGKNYYMGNLVSMPRGFSENFYADRYFMGSVDYAFPIYLGDFNLWKLAYVKRMQVIPFADYGVLGKGRISSCGASVLVDLAPFAFGFNCSVGVQYSYNNSSMDLPGVGSTAKMLFSVSL